MNRPKCHNENKQMQHEICKNKIDNIIERDDDSNNVTIDDAIHYWHEGFQLIKEDENKLFNPHG
jgi:exonuclease VII small subunit